MRRAPILDMAALRREQTRQTLATRIAGLPGADVLDTARISVAAAAYLEQAVQHGFTLGQGAANVGLLAAQYGVGFLQDAQHRQLAALSRADIRGDEGWRLALLTQWTDWHAARQVEASPAGTLARLHRLAALIQTHGLAVLAKEPAQVFAAIDPAKAVLHGTGHWPQVVLQWQGYLAQTYAGVAQFQIDYACCVAFCCGQYFAYDPLWDRLSDLRPESLYAFLK